MPVFNVNIADSEQTPHFAASDQSLYCLLMSLLWDVRHKCPNYHIFGLILR